MRGPVWRGWPPDSVREHGWPVPERGGPGPGETTEFAQPAAEVLSGLEYVVVDVETTGGSAVRGHRITEIALLRVGPDGAVLEEFCTLVNPERPIPRFITKLTRITDDMVRSAPRFHEIARTVETWIRGRIFVAHNAAFDRRFVGSELARATGIHPEYRTLCTLRLARRLVPEVRSRSLDSLTYYFGIDNEARHRAYGDARATVEVLRRLLERAQEREIGTWAEMEALLASRAPRRKRQARPRSIDVI